MRQLVYSVLLRRAFVVFLVAFLSPTGFAVADETMTTPAPGCGFTPAVTENSYSGRVEITASGNVFFVPPNGYYDPFYNNTVTGPANINPPSPLTLAWFSDGACTCSLECAGRNFPASDLLISPYPEYNPLHTYTVVLDLGPVPDRIAFGIPDCGCWDNSGTWTITIKQLLPLPDFGVSRALLRFDSSFDGSHVEGEFNGAPGFILDPSNQEVFVRLGTFNAVIPPGSFVLQPNGSYKFRGAIDGAQLSVEIGATSGGVYKFGIDAVEVDLSGTSNPMGFELRIGEEYGVASIKFVGNLIVHSGK